MSNSRSLKKIRTANKKTHKRMTARAYCSIWRGTRHWWLYSGSWWQSELSLYISLLPHVSWWKLREN